MGRSPAPRLLHGCVLQAPSAAGGRRGACGAARPAPAYERSRAAAAAGRDRRLRTRDARAGARDRPGGPDLGCGGVLDDDPGTHGRRVQRRRGDRAVGRVHDHADTLVTAYVTSPDDPSVASALVSRLDLPPQRYATLVHPAAVVPTSASIGSAAYTPPPCSPTDVELGPT